MMSKVEVKFSDDGSVLAKGFDLSSEAKWSLSGARIKIQGSRDSWPEMLFDPQGPKIHLTMEKGNDQLRMDLVKG